MDAVVLLSGGLDSCVVLAKALHDKKSCFALSFYYGQRHSIELERAQALAIHYQVPHVIVNLDQNLFKGHSSLTSNDKDVEKEIKTELPSTYVPCRNLLFLSHASCLAETHGATEIHFGANKDDALQYPDCRPEFIQALESTVEKGSKTAFTQKKIHFVTPLINLRKKEIVSLGRELQVPLHLTWSCYNPQGKDPCGNVAPASFGLKRLRKSVLFSLKKLTKNKE